MNAPYRIVIGDDHEHARKAIRMIIESDPAFKIIGEATNGQDVIQLTEQTMPDLILMDINMPVLNGLQTTGIIKERFPAVKIAIVTVSDDASDLFEALKRGAQGYLLKNLNPEVWIEYLHTLVNNEALISREIAQRMMKEFNRSSIAQPNDLTQREQEILTFVAKGWSNKEIANHLTLSEHTVKNHLKNIMHKLHLKNRVQLTRYAYEQGWA
ncbi:response regulator [Desmospora activa]|uniref:LuxR family two component transcriptional regulator n=1 Tax=Desmospora activa DSM 45169 TaxID=1121389 RepID=A0A2T4Z1I7_9BACL|nr:response regulator transcription factor [Desmospora activa]PTM54639.1 LuxR family two component transcriptional regulator [Desmospora activa DSM 45169]